MEKYEKLMKGLEACAGPDCCGEHCPYYGETRGGKTCRAWLLHDAAEAIANEEAGSDTLLELLHNTEAERDGLRIEMETMKENYDIMRMRVQVQQNEINALMSKVSKQEGKKDKASASDNDLRNEYRRGYKEALEFCFRELCARVGGGCRHE